MRETIRKEIERFNAQDDDGNIYTIIVYRDETRQRLSSGKLVTDIHPQKSYCVLNGTEYPVYSTNERGVFRIGHPNRILVKKILIE